jgi:hypothetical protein
MTELKKQTEHETGYSGKERQFYFFFVTGVIWKKRGTVKYLKRENAQGSIKNLKGSIRRMLD